MHYSKVIADFATGKLNRETTRLVMDNDGGYWSVNITDEEVENLSDEKMSEIIDEMEKVQLEFRESFDQEERIDFIKESIREERCDELSKEYGTPDGYADLVHITNAAGIPCEWC